MDFPSDNIQVPKPQTLKKYGLTEQDFMELFHKQGGICPICERPLSKPRIDHDHVKGWKKMPDEVRKKFVRGLLCFFCNKYYVGRSITIKRAKNVVTYLQRYEKRKPK